MVQINLRALRRSAGLHKRAARYAMRELELNRLFRPRRIDLCCCGLSKSGTHSIAGMFGRYRSQHHPDRNVRVPLSISLIKGEISVAKASSTLGKRDRKLWLEMESSTLTGILVEPLMDACPGKRFILTIRDVFSWSESWLDHNINRPPGPKSQFAALDRTRLRADEIAPGPHDAPLIELGFPSLACFFQMWAEHNSRILDVVPPDRLFVLKTADINERLDEIARWAGVERDMLCGDRTWLAKPPVKHHVLSKLDPNYVQDSAERFCGSLMDRFFDGLAVSEYFERHQAR